MARTADVELALDDEDVVNVAGDLERAVWSHIDITLDEGRDRGRDLHCRNCIGDRRLIQAENIRAVSRSLPRLEGLSGVTPDGERCPVDDRQVLTDVQVVQVATDTDARGNGQRGAIKN